MFQDRFGSRHRVFEEPVAAAGILADGATTGDASLLTGLLFRRSSMLWAVETASKHYPMLDDAMYPGIR